MVTQPDPHSVLACAEALAQLEPAKWRPYFTRVQQLLLKALVERRGWERHDAASFVFQFSKAVCDVLAAAYAPVPADPDRVLH